MKIIEPSTEIIEDKLSALSIYQRIDKCGSICYQRAEKGTDEEAQEFCRSMVSRKHLTTLEMAQIYLIYECDNDEVVEFGKYINVECINFYKYLICGSIRSFKERWDSLDLGIKTFLATEYPLFFPDEMHCCGWPVRFAEPHEIPRSHQYVAVKVVCSRSISHQLIRHRPFSFLQESQRYCRYEDGVTFIRPEWAPNYSQVTDDVFWQTQQWMKHMQRCEDYYHNQLYRGLSPQQVRGGLPNDTKTELIMYGSLPMWDHVFELRCAAGADPEMRRLMLPLRNEFISKYGDK